MAQTTDNHDHPARAEGSREGELVVAGRALELATIAQEQDQPAESDRHPEHRGATEGFLQPDGRDDRGENRIGQVEF